MSNEITIRKDGTEEFFATVSTGRVALAMIGTN